MAGHVASASSLTTGVPCVSSEQYTLAISAQLNSGSNDAAKSDDGLIERSAKNDIDDKLALSLTSKPVPTLCSDTNARMPMPGDCTTENAAPTVSRCWNEIATGPLALES